MINEELFDQFKKEILRLTDNVHNRCEILKTRMDEFDKMAKESQVAFHMQFHDAINTRMENIHKVLGMELDEFKSKRILKIEEVLGRHVNSKVETELFTTARKYELEQFKKINARLASLEEEIKTFEKVDTILTNDSIKEILKSNKRDLTRVDARDICGNCTSDGFLSKTSFLKNLDQICPKCLYEVDARIQDYLKENHKIYQDKETDEP